MEAVDAIIDRSFGTENQHRRSAARCAELLHQRKPIQPGQHDIDYGGVIRNTLGSSQSVYAIGAEVNSKTALLQAIGHEGADFGVVFHHQDAHLRHHNRKSRFQNLKSKIEKPSRA